VCYPAAGYGTVDPRPATGEVRAPGSDTRVRFSKAYYVKNFAGASEYSEAIWTFRQNGLWLGDVKDNWKTFRYHPAMFKIQIHRPAMSIVMDNGPSEDLLGYVASAIESQLAASEAAKGRVAPQTHASRE
jgi:hypothetical protein